MLAVNIINTMNLLSQLECKQVSLIDASFISVHLGLPAQETYIATSAYHWQHLCLSSRQLARKELLIN
jgi:hypothetical protein